MYFWEERRINHLIIFILEKKILFQSSMLEYFGIKLINTMRFKILAETLLK